MNEFKLIIGDKHASSWSLRAWLMLKQCLVDFDEQIIRLGQSDTKQKILQVSLAGKVPVLKHQDIIIWESLAIGEYLSELYPQVNLWPEDRNARAVARAVSNEMHAGFTNLRSKMPFDLLNKHQFPEDDELVSEIKRVEQIWEACRTNYGQASKFLFGNFGIADAMYAPVVLRFDTYGYLSSNYVVRKYCSAVIEYSNVQYWLEQARK